MENLYWVNRLSSYLKARINQTGADVDALDKMLNLYDQGEEADSLLEDHPGAVAEDLFWDAIEELF